MEGDPGLYHGGLTVPPVDDTRVVCCSNRVKAPTRCPIRTPCELATLDPHLSSRAVDALDGRCAGGPGLRTQATDAQELASSPSSRGRGRGDLLRACTEPLGNLERQLMHSFVGAECQRYCLRCSQ